MLMLTMNSDKDMELWSHKVGTMDTKAMLLQEIFFHTWKIIITSYDQTTFSREEVVLKDFVENLC